jgi:HD-GYP domain-containing protein (c-di-GMP phosphodiesterase class II)
MDAQGAMFRRLAPEGELMTMGVRDLSDLDLEALQFQLPSELAAVSQFDAPFAFALEDKQALACPIRVGEGPSGLLVVCRPSAQPFSSREAKLLAATGRQAALAIRNRSLVEELRSLFVSTVQALVAAIEAKDPYTCGHSRRVGASARATARILGLSESRIEDIHTAAVVHDVGKIGVDTAILRKTGRLDAQEWRAVRTHPDRGAGIIGCVPQLRHITGAVRHHHERSDGSGYPQGLIEAQIPLEAGIIAVCDSYDAMTSQRPYRAAMSHQQALAELQRCSGTQFAAGIVDAFAAGQAA